MSNKPELLDISIEQEFPKERPDYWIQCKFSNHQFQAVKVERRNDIKSLVKALHMLAESIESNEDLIPRYFKPWWVVLDVTPSARLTHQDVGKAYEQLMRRYINEPMNRANVQKAWEQYNNE